MKRVIAAVLATLVLATPAMGQETRLRAARVTADDVAATAKFYESTFGMTQVRKVDRSGALFEIILNYGATPADAGANMAAKLVVIARPKDAGPASMSPLVFGVKDLEGVMAKAVGAGGSVSRPASTAGSGTRIAFVKDPAGNEIELIQE